jgi:cytoskeleton protein RodZ
MTVEQESSIGQSLRARREERGISVEQASAESRVPLRLLQAMESDDYRLLPDPLYLIRFLHDYARFLGLDASALEAEFQRVARRPLGAPLPPASSVPGPRTVPWRQLAWMGAALLVVTPLVFIALSLASKRAADRTAAPAAQHAAPGVPASGPPAGPVPAAGPVASGDAAPAPEAAGAAPHVPGSPLSSLGDAPAPPAPGPSAAPGQPSPAVLTATAQEQTWMVVRADAAEPREVLLQAGQTIRFTADGKFRVTLGNAGGVSLTLNGVPLPSLGRSGQVVRDVTLPDARSALGEGGAAQPPGRPER